MRGGGIPRRREPWTMPPPREVATSDSDEPPSDDAASQPAALTGTTTAEPAELNLTRSHLAVGVIVAAVALAATVVVLWSAQPREQAVPLAAQAAATVSPAPTAAAAPTLPPVAGPGSTAAGPDQRVEVVVHVAGKVRRPGVIRLPAGSRVIDAVEAAGGARPSANLSTVNLARELQDGEQVRIGLPPAADTEAGALAGDLGSSAPIDLNAAGADALESLPGVGPVLAARIVAYREQTGGFESVDQLIEVPGIGPAVLSGLDGLVRV